MRDPFSFARLVIRDVRCILDTPYYALEDRVSQDRRLATTAERKEASCRKP